MNVLRHPQSNGQVEISNRTLKEGLKKRLEEAKTRWPEELSNILCDFRTTIRTSTGQTHFLLICGTDALLAVKVDILRIRKTNIH